MRPTVGILLVGAACAALLARRSVAYPVGLAGLSSIAFAIFGSNPLPSGGVTLIVAAWIGLALLLAVIRGDAPPLQTLISLPVLVSLALLAAMIGLLGSSLAPDYGSLSLQLFVAANLTLLVAGVFIGWRGSSFNLFMMLTLAIAAAGAFVLVVQLLTGGAQTVLPGRFTASPDEDPIALGRESAQGLLIAIYVILAARAASARFWGMVALPPLAIALVAAGSRGPVIGFVLGLAVLFALTAASRVMRVRLIPIALGALAVFALVPVVVPGATITRSLSVLTASGDLSSNGRTELWSQAWSAFSAHPLLGVGTGGFAGIRPDEGYPHNLLLEAAANFGVVGVLLIVTFLLSAGRRLVAAWRASQEDDRLAAAAILALFCCTVVNALFSGGIPNNGAVWLWAGVGVGLSARLLRNRSRAAPRGAATRRRRSPPSRAVAPAA